MTTVDTEPLAPLEVAGRIPKLREKLAKERIDGLLVVSLTNVRYLTGFSGSAGILLVTPDEARLATDGRYRTQAAEQIEAAGLSPTVELFVGKPLAQRDVLKDAAARALSRGDSANLGLESEAVTWGEALRWKEALSPVEPVPVAGIVESLRVVKDAGEVARIGAACSIADSALAQIESMLDSEVTESEVAIALDFAMRRLGAEDRSFETIVASGPNSAKPHAEPGDRRIRKGDTVVIDFGAIVDGYHSDMTRTFFAGGVVPKEMKTVYEAVLRSQLAGVAAVRAGVSGGEVDAVCRLSLTEDGLGEAFEHGTGHGVGLDIHEAPSVGQGRADILEPGTVVTVEPGAYLAGLGGVRIEDTVVVTEEGCRALTEFRIDRI